MELQCKERVDLLVALRQSRAGAKETGENPIGGGTLRDMVQIRGNLEIEASHSAPAHLDTENPVAAVEYPEITKLHAPPLPSRPTILQKKGSQSSGERSQSSPQIHATGTEMPYAPAILPVPSRQSKTPSPEKRSRMLTTLRGTKDGKKPFRSPRLSTGRKTGQPVASKAAGLAWDSVSQPSGQNLRHSLSTESSNTVTLNSLHRNSLGDISGSRRGSAVKSEGEDRKSSDNGKPPPAPLWPPNQLYFNHPLPNSNQEDSIQKIQNGISALRLVAADTRSSTPAAKDRGSTKAPKKSPERPMAPADFISYRNEYLPTAPSIKSTAQYAAHKPPAAGGGEISSTLRMRQRSPDNRLLAPVHGNTSRRPVVKLSSDQQSQQNLDEPNKPEFLFTAKTESPISKTPDEPNRISPDAPLSKMTLTDRIDYIKKHLPKGVDENAAKQIFNEIVVQGDEVHWDDVAGLDVAKKALKEAVVYPFLRPDLFMGLREPARGMLLFGPPGTGKTMLARAVATESRSTFFAISASSLTSKWLGESEKLVRALFSLAKALAPSIIFVDEIDSLLSSRGGSTEHESTRRIKTEFLIQWSDLQRAAAGKLQSDKEKQEGDASRVLVLAATNLPWAIDEAARRRFVRRQYIPLPEGHVRATQLRTLLSHQKHNLNQQDIEVLVEVTDGIYTYLI